MLRRRGLSSLTGLVLIAAGLALLWSVDAYVEARVEFDRRHDAQLERRGVPCRLRRPVARPVHRPTELGIDCAVTALVVVAGVLQLRGLSP